MELYSGIDRFNKLLKKREKDIIGDTLIIEVFTDKSTESPVKDSNSPFTTDELDYGFVYLVKDLNVEEGKTEPTPNKYQMYVLKGEPDSLYIENIGSCLRELD